jgi:flagellar basal-body rod modification protein FlgD
VTTTTSSTSGSSSGVAPQTLLDQMNGASSSSASSSSSSTSPDSPQSLQNTFLQLLVTQLQNQDPTNPMDSSQMTSQLAQINTVSGISQLNTTLTSLASQLQASQSAQAALLIGSSVLVPGNMAFVSNSKSGGFGIQLPSDASDVQVTVKDSSGNVVSTIDLGPHAAGNVPVAWDPVDSSGNALPDGTYTISAQATVGGQTSSVNTLSAEQVLSVIQESSGGTGLMLQDGSTVDQSQVVAIL